MVTQNVAIFEPAYLFFYTGFICIISFRVCKHTSYSIKQLNKSVHEHVIGISCEYFLSGRGKRGRVILKITANYILKVQPLVGSNCKLFRCRWLVMDGVKLGYLGYDTP